MVGLGISGTIDSIILNLVPEELMHGPWVREHPGGRDNPRGIQKREEVDTCFLAKIVAYAIHMLFMCFWTFIFLCSIRI